MEENMKEIGGYIELDTYNLPTLHENALHLNCGRNALAYLIESRKIKKIVLPYFLCNSVKEICDRYHLEIRFYHINIDFIPDNNLKLADDEWLYVVNYYGQITVEMLKKIKEKHTRIIVDNAQAYFDMPIEDTDTIYTCRKYFGVSDGAILYTNSNIARDLPQDESFERMRFLLGRFERTASEFYEEYVKNNDFFENEPIRKMSKLTYNLLHGIDYEFVKKRRTENFSFLHKEFEKINRLKLTIPDGAFMYPLYIPNGEDIRKKLQAEKIYIPTLWNDVFYNCNESDLECDMARNILPLPVDQRYGIQDVTEIINQVLSVIK